MNLSEQAQQVENSGLPPELQHQQRIMREMEAQSAQPVQEAASPVETPQDIVQQLMSSPSASSGYAAAEASAPAPIPEPVAPVHPQPSFKDIDQARNFRAVKQAAEQAARERDEALARLRQYESPQQHQHIEEEEEVEEINVKPDDLVEGKHLIKYNKEIRDLKKQLKNFASQSHASNSEVRLRAQYPDFDKVMTLENIRALSAAYPELAKSINATNDLYDKSVSAYTLIKRFGIYDETPPFEAEKQKALANAAKPRPLASVSPQQGDSPMQRANIFAQGLTDELKQKLREEMAAAAKRY